MKRIGVILLLLTFALSPYAQQRRTTKGKARTTVVKKKTARKTTKKEDGFHQKVDGTDRLCAESAEPACEDTTANQGAGAEVAF